MPWLNVDLALCARVNSVGVDPIDDAIQGHTCIERVQSGYEFFEV